jgi:hypothetical protein
VGVVSDDGGAAGPAEGAVGVAVRIGDRHGQVGQQA